MRAGRRVDALKLSEEVHNLSSHMYLKPSSMAQLSIALGKHDEAFQWLDRAYEEQDSTIATLKVETLWDPLRSDPRFKELLKRVHLDE